MFKKNGVTYQLASHLKFLNGFNLSYFWKMGWTTPRKFNPGWTGLKQLIVSFQFGEDIYAFCIFN